MNFKRLSLLISFLLVLAASLSGCLKTRAQLREDQDDARPEPAHVEDVKPQGQYVIDELKSEMTRLQGRIEDLERTQKDTHQTAAVKANSDELKKMEGRLVELEMAQANVLEELKKLRETAAPADPAEAFDKGKAHFDAGQYDGAVDSFTAYLRVPKGKRAEDATFYRGESFYALKQYKKAIVDYSKFPEK